MAAPPLHEIDRVADQLAGVICSTMPGSGPLWQLTGAPTAGKTAALHALAFNLDLLRD